MRVSNMVFESGPLRAVCLSRHKWPGGVMVLERASAVLSVAALDAVQNFHKEDGTKVRTPTPSFLLYYAQA